MLTRASSATPDERFAILQELRLYELDVQLLLDARRGYATHFSNKWVGADEQLGFPAFEVRDRQGPGWRGAVVISDGDPWLVFAVIKRSAGRIVEKMRQQHMQGKLMPSAADLRLRDAEELLQESRSDRVRLLRALLDTLHRALSSVSIGADIVVSTSGIANAAGVEISVGLSDLSGLADSDDWGPLDAHKYVDVLALCLTLRTRDPRSREWVLDTCLPFLQPDCSQIESVNGWPLTVSVSLTRARLAQLLANRENPPAYETQAKHPPEPTVLHYADRDRITRAFVYGESIRAVCGTWWIPVGDASTRPDLPICLECEQELPAARALREVLSWWTDA